jgi:hypothetical protein
MTDVSVRDVQAIVARFVLHASLHLTYRRGTQNPDSNYRTTTTSVIDMIVTSKRAKAMLHLPLTDIAALSGASAFR